MRLVVAGMMVLQPFQVTALSLHSLYSAGELAWRTCHVCMVPLHCQPDVGDIFRFGDHLALLCMCDLCYLCGHMAVQAVMYLVLHSNAETRP